ncbi:nicotinate (nicotinamide) nucleotide adenylyltransferase [Zwartia sp. IMCC34845]|nr:nicotinate (nicotinamide) nucleotide adenylyltransferase [Zwartia vadi]MDN3988851.1 nicotinate (nicotinamide) nucleotide adenylyltransferase [Zwartia vadi]
MGLMRIGLLGGSFDPVHHAHLSLARTALKALNLDQIQLIPAGQPWQRPPLGASPEHRLNMLKLATRDMSSIAINPIEINRSGPTYTIETVNALDPNHDYIWILGSDQLKNFCTWKNWPDIAEHVHLAVAQRPGSSLTAPEPLAQFLSAHNRKLLIIPFEPLDISATAVRQRLTHQQSAKDLIPEVVEQYIHEHGLYRPLNA